ncbi:MerR family transcriptional regulator [Lactococcus garvieae]|uniref:MerR family transcriptional regulator n=1 Tax=Lactococcus garvieae TaxID=1363 RepID=UPI001F60E739|nr:MerR family transcriptional regulator [Lactococcus garvieae]MCI3861382.1 MerR family transcriptional regulator [Lactococcus garvieae]
MQTYTIGDISRKLNVSTDAVRYYDKEGLLPFVKRNSSGRREFTDNDLGYIEVIDCLKKSGIPIKDIAKFIQWCIQGDETLKERLIFMEEHEEQLEGKIKALETNLKFLRWKIWYYKKAVEAGTEKTHFLPGTTQVDPKIKYSFEKKI